MKSKAVIFAGGTISGLEYISLLNDVKFENISIICVDKGVNYALENNINIDIAIGDFDSVSKKSIDYLKNSDIKILNFNKDKDMTDMELALDFCFKNNCKEVYLFGATGTRYDHSISNINLLKTYSLKGLKISIIDENNYIFYINESTVIKKLDRKISILPTNEKCVFNLYGTKWELVNHNLKFGSSLTISNEFYNDVNIEILNGDMFVILSKD
ncbi:thiamine diphosphokinase [Helcococcus ovis]|uniref:Thiamine diphosphokinase n=2 Tax=Helcococcus ovis TaxID=72026 RepID=A0A4R9C5C1_9FIRM|nr:thiamine diphosphokinase [Helcococcus ovis]TFF64392.1 thiamine diphosphokinase [Helcococcus ovis]TFF66784.1 thiamine diphosphokinase [Helcococcus ovis]TFF67125.1 thiamine diphosphokinase [Helcococcus ovis]WNZ01937.1 thiamine diphosphokinase [Helcococcus ovis]